MVNPPVSPSVSLPRPFRFRLNYVDHYQSQRTPFDPILPYHPYTLGRNPSFTLPVMRAFGTTEMGQKVCVHIHGVFPYIFIEADISSAESQDAVDTYLSGLKTSIDVALGRQFAKDNHRRNLGSYVAHLELVKGVPFFGFHVGYQLFVKLYLLKPAYVAKLSNLLLMGEVIPGKGSIQPYESHLQYQLQWMCDFNLYGCSFVDCSVVAFRSPVPRFHQKHHDPRSWNLKSIPTKLISPSASLPRQSRCELEIDLCAWHITNRSVVRPRNLHYHFLDRLGVQEPPEGQKLVPSLAALWKDEAHRRGTHGTDHFQEETRITMSADPDARMTDWLGDEEYQREILSIIDRERLAGKYAKLKDSHFVRDIGGISNVPTVLEAISSLFPSVEGKQKLDRASHSTFPSTFMSTFVGDPNTPEKQNDPEESSYFSRNYPPLKDDMQPDITPAGLDMNVPNDDDGDYLDPTNSSTDGEENSSDEEDDPGKEGLSLLPRPSQFDPNRIKLHKDVLQKSYVMDIAKAVADQSTPRSKKFHSQDVNLQSPFLQRLRSEVEPPGLSVNFPSSDLRFQTNSYGHIPDHSPSTRVGLRSMIVPPEFHHLSSSPCVTTPSVQPLSVCPEVSRSHTETLTSLELSSRRTRDIADALASSSRPSKVLFFNPLPLDFDSVVPSFSEVGLPEVFYLPSHYSNVADVPTTVREFGGHVEHIVGTTLEWLPLFDPASTSISDSKLHPTFPTSSEALEIRQNLKRGRERCAANVHKWEILDQPPSWREVNIWLQNTDKTTLNSVRNKKKRVNFALSQIDGPTQQPRLGYTVDDTDDTATNSGEADLSEDLTILSIEVIADSRGTLLPNPSKDPILAVFWSLQTKLPLSLDGVLAEDAWGSESDSDTGSHPTGHPRPFHKAQSHQGIIIFDCPDRKLNLGPTLKKFGSPKNLVINVEKTEIDLLNRLVGLVTNTDPDVLIGYDIIKGSWGYILDRAQRAFEFDMWSELGRVNGLVFNNPSFPHSEVNSQALQRCKVVGRHLINLWRAMRGELSDLTSFTVENISERVLRRRIPKFSLPQLAKWFTSPLSQDVHRVTSYMVLRAQLNVDLADATDLIERTVEQARLIGIEFSAVYSRGSQFKVESLMFRLAKAENFMLISPSPAQVSRQHALECIPLVMEPRSRVYWSPIVVLDFRSLYPSVLIAHNYCYSTCLGRLDADGNGKSPLGFTTYTRQSRLLERLRAEEITVAPNELVFVRPSVRKSLMARMLTEILETRVMIKAAMAADSGTGSSHKLTRLRHNRQLALKLIANVTYGYASASFSGRMPCAELADAIVQTGRETVERAIGLIESIPVPGWAGAEVVYGDTDSIFVHLPGRSAESARQIGLEMAAAVTAVNPRPIKLQFEKVYLPSVLLTKKRYAGLKVSSSGALEWDAKGIESVRRDGTPASRKIMQSAVTELFKNGGDISPVRDYILAQCYKLLAGRIPVPDLCFAKEVHPTRYDIMKGPIPASLPLGLAAAFRQANGDPRATPQEGERVPYIIVRGAPGAKLIDRAIHPTTLLGRGHSYEIDTEYYITHNILPPLDRVLNLIGASAAVWFEHMPRPRKQAVLAGATTSLTAFFRAAHCSVCDTPIKSESRTTVPLVAPKSVQLCANCAESDNRQTVLASVIHQLQRVDIRHSGLVNACRQCQSRSAETHVYHTPVCVNSDCDLFFTSLRATAARDEAVNRLMPVITHLEYDDANEDHNESISAPSFVLSSELLPAIKFLILNSRDLHQLR